MIEDNKDWQKHISDERITKSFSIDMETLVKVKQFMEKYHKTNFSRAVDDLVNIGLANLGYRTEKEIVSRFKGCDDFTFNSINLPEPNELYDFNSISSGLMDSQHEKMKTILKIVQRLINYSKDGEAYRNDIVKEGEIEGLDTNEILSGIDRLKRNGQIYEPKKDKYKITEY